MYSTFLRLGLWTLILVLATYVFRESLAQPHVAEMIPTGMLQQAIVLAGILIALGVIARIFDKGASKVRKNRCRTCQKPIAPAALYCREHLRTILAEEDEKTHMTRVRR
ncbi:MAG TPA: hypothetical protein VGF48_22155 [Thermoanaerobaculia bacterium]|jgi:TRAP-type C4-dicarboxylate transport system permease small subunit